MRSAPLPDAPGEHNFTCGFHDVPGRIDGALVSDASHPGRPVALDFADQADDGVWKNIPTPSGNYSEKQAVF